MSELLTESHPEAVVLQALSSQGIPSQTLPAPVIHRWQRVAAVDDVKPEGVHVVEVEGQTLALFMHEDVLYAVDNRCPHMGFPLHQGSVHCGILTCHWHHARFDLASGGTFDPWADDLRAYPVRIENGEIWADLNPPSAPAQERFSARLSEGLKRNLSLLIAKSVIGLHAAGVPDTVAVSVGADFGTRYSRMGWGSGLTILTAMANILPALDEDDRPRALYQGLLHVAQQTAGRSPAFVLDPLPTTETRPEVFKTWFREFLEVRDRDAAERTLRTAIRVGVPMPAVADMLFAAVTDHVYINGGHSLDFVNKAFEMLDLIGWEQAEQILPSLVPELANARRSEESSGWRHPIDLVQLLTETQGRLPALAEEGKRKQGAWNGRSELVTSLLQDNPQVSIDALQTALAEGASWEQLAGAVAFAAARRIAQFRTSNEFGDWITVLHTFTYANAVQQAMRRAPSLELLRGVFDAAMSVYLDRFLNMPPAALPASKGDAPVSLDALLDIMDKQQQVGQSALFIHVWLTNGRSDTELLAALGGLLLREDAEFHSFQMVEAGFRQYADLRGTEEGCVVLIAIARYLAAHSPTPRALGQTYQTALRLHKGENLYTE
jgi:nitrite reductase/ring-hydroxylating ferredoxin subunit